MKIHYTNILLFPLKLNILVNTHKKPHTTARHTQKIPTTRSLSECELYAPVNYYSDPQMKEVMDNFNKQTQQRFHEYDDRMKTTRQKCKDKCDKEIQKIILKYKLEKQMAQQFSTLHTDIQSDAIPTCVCEKSLADKVEKGCLRCGSILGAAMPEMGSIGGGLLYALNAWKPAALLAATKYAMEVGATKGAAAGLEAGKKAVIDGLNALGVYNVRNKPLESIIGPLYYTDFTKIGSIIRIKKNELCWSSASNVENPMCTNFTIKLGTITETGDPALTDTIAISQKANAILTHAKEVASEAAEAAEKGVVSEITKNQTTLIEAEFNSSISSINASIIAILIIVLIMVIIYLILRYRRKKKMKKKLQYIKLLEE
ncbi:hypothetical protein PFDG_01747 [Plasmodium falciparum Dd2]|uniref:Rifin n=1 Tax=Plasmodium falciparum (isolate Dd2) TaxID=57267 RepID=A0A0L7M0W0_PLAF4|nr:hypothetical protein PFDG_01747 [Plasmodium falciparum Dd2]